MERDLNSYATIICDKLSYEIVSTTTQVINHNTGFDLKYQENKLYNLKLLQESLDGLTINPGEVFSFNYSIRKVSKKERFKDGLVIVNNKMKQESGGGICHMSNQLYRSFLHTPLTVIERHPHKTDYFPSGIHNVVGLDATVSSGWLDLKVKNTTNHKYQLDLEFIDEQLVIKIRSDYPKQYDYQIKNRNIQYISERDKTYKSYDVIKETYLNKSTKIEEVLVSTDFVEIAYNTKENNNE